MSTITVSAGPVRRPVGRTMWPSAQSPAVAQAGHPGVRLTRRGRLVLTLSSLVLLVLVAVLTSGGGPAVAGSEPGAAATADLVTVRPGETLWSIAQRESPGVDPRKTIARILDLNALDSAAVQAGSVLLLPAD